MSQAEIDKNLLAVVAVEGYAEKHHLTEEEVYKEFSKYNILSLVREEYEALHTQSLEETVGFVEDVMARCKRSERGTV